MTSNPASGDELFVHLDVTGLAALMKAIESAMTDGPGHLILGGASGIVVRCGSSARPFAGATLTFDPTDPRDDGRRRPGDPEPRPRAPVLELQR